MRAQPRKLVLILALAACAFAAVGCSRVDRYRNNLTPEVDTLSMTHDEIENRSAIMRDQNFSQINSDLQRFWFFDRPSRLTPHPVAW